MDKPKVFTFVISNTSHKQDKSRNERSHDAKRHKSRECAICCNHSEFFGIGPCLHPICMECSIRLRIIGQSKSCPQCREDIETLYFVYITASQSAFVLPESTIQCSIGAGYGIKFVNDDAVRLFNRFMAHKCSRCPSDNLLSFPTFAALHHHVVNVHGLSFCRLCTENINSLSKDRKLYSRPYLQLHMDGKLRELGFTGHPKCLFCDLRFYDKEEQYRHLRKDHFYCAICEQGGVKDNFFYKNRQTLSRHYQARHYPCRYRECVEVPIAFQDQNELTIHRAREHHERNTQLDFHFSKNASSNQPRQETVNQNQAIVSVTPSAQSNSQSVRIVPFALNPTSDFPNLPSNPLPSSALLRQVKSRPVVLAEQFPSLSSVPVKQSPSIWVKGKTGNLVKEKPQVKPKPAIAPPKRNPVVVEEPGSLPKLDIWTEEMRRKREERLKLYGLESKEAKELKPITEKKKKPKTVRIVSADKGNDGIRATQSIFQALYSLDDPSQMNGSSNLWNKAKKSGFPKK